MAIKLTPVATKAKVLVVEDDEAANAALKQLLKMHKYKVDTVFNAEDAMNIVKTNRYDVVLLDVNLPVMSGFNLFRNIKKQFVYTEIIMLTGAPNFSDAVSIAKEGAFEYIPKPFESKKLLSTVEAACKARDKALEDDMEKTTQIEGGFLYGYNFIRNLGSGNMGDVMLVEKDAQCYALKQVRPVSSSLNSINSMRKFLDVIETVSKLNHPNLVKIHSFGIPNGLTQPFVLMEYLANSSLMDYIDNKEMNLSFSDKVKIIGQVASALSEVHQAGIIHRDVKPSNVLLNQDMNAKLTDFGISSLMTHTETINLAGSPAFMAPECFEEDGTTTTKVDIFSLGVLSYELLTGQRPFTGGTISEMIHAIRVFKPQNPQQFEENISDDINNILASMLMKKPSMRPNAGDIAQAVQYLFEDGIPDDFRQFKDGGLRYTWNDT